MKRFRLLLAAAAVVLVAVLGFAAPSHAEGEGDVKVGHAEHECIELLEEGKKIDDCQAAPNQLLPETNELIWGAIGFFIVFGFLAKVGLPAIKKGMQDRTDRIQGDLDAAEAQRVEAEGILAQYQAQLADARAESGRIVEEARQAADEVRTTLTAKAQADVDEMKAKAQADVEAFKAQAMADLRGEVASLAIAAAEQVVGRNLDRDTNVALVESFIDQVGAKS